MRSRVSLRREGGGLSSDLYAVAIDTAAGVLAALAIRPVVANRDSEPT
jgi:hypothetical protein